MYAFSFIPMEVASISHMQVVPDNPISLLVFGGQAEHAYAHTILSILPAQFLFCISQKVEKRCKEYFRVMFMLHPILIYADHNRPSMMSATKETSHRKTSIISFICTNPLHRFPTSPTLVASLLSFFASEVLYILIMQIYVSGHAHTSS